MVRKLYCVCVVYRWVIFGMLSNDFGEVIEIKVVFC